MLDSEAIGLVYSRNIEGAREPNDAAPGATFSFSIPRAGEGHVAGDRRFVIAGPPAGPEA
jgi:hypothetical protein